MIEYNDLKFSFSYESITILFDRYMITFDDAFYLVNLHRVHRCTAAHVHRVVRHIDLDFLVKCQGFFLYNDLKFSFACQSIWFTIHFDRYMITYDDPFYLVNLNKVHRCTGAPVHRVVRHLDLDVLVECHIFMKFKCTLGTKWLQILIYIREYMVWHYVGYIYKKIWRRINILKCW